MTSMNNKKNYLSTGKKIRVTAVSSCVPSRLISLALAFVMMVALLTGCNDTNTVEPTTTIVESSQSPEPSNPITSIPPVETANPEATSSSAPADEQTDVSSYINITDEAQIEAASKLYFDAFDESERLFTLDEVILTNKFLNGVYNGTEEIEDILAIIDKVIYGGIDVTRVPATNNLAGVEKDNPKSTAVGIDALIPSGTLGYDIVKMFEDYRIAIQNPATSKEDREKLCKEAFTKECLLLFGDLELNGKVFNIADLEDDDKAMYLLYASLQNLHALYCSVMGDDFTLPVKTINDEEENQVAYIVNQILNEQRYIFTTRKAEFLDLSNPKVLENAIKDGFVIDRGNGDYYTHQTAALISLINRHLECLNGLTLD